MTHDEQKICHPCEQGITRVIATILRNFRVGVNVRKLTQPSITLPKTTNSLSSHDVRFVVI